MPKSFPLIAILALGAFLLPNAASAASCKTQSQMTPAQRDALLSAARGMMAQVQRDDTQGLRTNTIPAVAADFGGIASSVDSLKTVVPQATITVESLYLLDATGEAPGTAQTDFFCGTPVVVMNFNGLPPGSYALAILHATGVPKPQQIALVLAESVDHRWMLGGFYAKPMTEAGHDGLWYWVSARKFAQKNMNWDAWFYARLAANLLDPVDFLSSPNLQKLQQEQEKVHPTNLPGQQPLQLSAHGASFQVTSVDTTVTFGPLDLEVHYAPDPAQAAELRDPTGARKQVTQLMTALLELHPDLPAAFHGIWVQADGGSAELFSLELPMDQIVPGSGPVAANSAPASH
jgi:hypothetical protein